MIDDYTGDVKDFPYDSIIYLNKYDNINIKNSLKYNKLSLNKSKDNEVYLALPPLTDNRFYSIDTTSSINDITNLKDLYNKYNNISTNVILSNNNSMLENLQQNGLNGLTGRNDIPCYLSDITLNNKSSAFYILTGVINENMLISSSLWNTVVNNRSFLIWDTEIQTFWQTVVNNSDIVTNNDTTTNDNTNDTTNVNESSTTSNTSGNIDKSSIANNNTSSLNYIYGLDPLEYRTITSSKYQTIGKYILNEYIKNINNIIHVIIENNITDEDIVSDNSNCSKFKKSLEKLLLNNDYFQTFSIDSLVVPLLVTYIGTTIQELSETTCSSIAYHALTICNIPQNMNDVNEDSKLNYCISVNKYDESTEYYIEYINNCFITSSNETTNKSNNISNEETTNENSNSSNKTTNESSNNSNDVTNKTSFNISIYPFINYGNMSTGLNDNETEQSNDNETKAQYNNTVIINDNVREYWKAMIFYRDGLRIILRDFLTVIANNPILFIKYGITQVTSIYIDKYLTSSTTNDNTFNNNSLFMCNPPMSVIMVQLSETAKNKHYIVEKDEYETDYSVKFDYDNDNQDSSTFSILSAKLVNNSSDYNYIDTLFNDVKKNSINVFNSDFITSLSDQILLEYILPSDVYELDSLLTENDLAVLNNSSLFTVTNALNLKTSNYPRLILSSEKLTGELTNTYTAIYKENTSEQITIKVPTIFIKTISSSYNSYSNSNSDNNNNNSDSNSDSKNNSDNAYYNVSINMMKVFYLYRSNIDNTVGNITISSLTTNEGNILLNVFYENNKSIPGVLCLNNY